MAPYTTARRRAIRKDEQAGHRPGRPAQLIPRNGSSQAPLGVVSPQRFLDRGQLRLHLDDEDRLCRPMPREQIDRPTLSPDRERDLWPNLPAQPFQPLADATDERRMALVEEPVKLAASPTDRHDEVRIEGADDRVQAVERHPVDPPALHVRHDVLADAGSLADILLPPRPVVPESPYHSPDALAVHAQQRGTRPLD